MEKKFVSDEIGMQYMEWKPYNRIFITANTGTGKSHFILYEYLKRGISNWYKNKNVIEKTLYMVNRRILKEQLEEELICSVASAMQKIYGITMPDIHEFITIMTYQELECAILQGEYYKINKLLTYSTVVYDECHYFLNDANYNTNTELSFDCLRYTFDDRIQIFISATMNDMEQIVMEREPVYMSQIGPHTFRDKEKRVIPYSVQNNYDYIDLYMFKDMEDLKSQIIEGLVERNEKWLIFTDSIYSGKKLIKDLARKNEIGIHVEKEKMVFIDAHYYNDMKASGAVDEAIRKKVMSYPVVVATAVMDNGISLFDPELRNIVILADTQDSFLQMLGRKRVDGKNINLFICRRDGYYFAKRQEYINRLLAFYTKYYDYWNGQKKFYYNGSFYEIQPFERYRNLLPLAAELPQVILKELNDSEASCEAYRRICYPLNGRVYVNRFSIWKLKQLRDFYGDMSDMFALDENGNFDENAFLRIQASWLGMKEDDLMNHIKKSEEDLFVLHCKTIEQKIRAQLEFLKENKKTHMTKEDNLMFRTLIMEEFKKISQIYYERTQDEQAQRDASEFTRTSLSKNKKNRRYLTSERFNRIMGYAQLMFEMAEEKEGYIIREKEQL